jgi:DNA polymerase epsilon subunit 1
VDYYFIQEDGAMFKATMPYEPYFYLSCRVSFISCKATGAHQMKSGTETIVEEWLMKRFEGTLVRVEREKKWDLDLVSLRYNE